MSSRVSTIPPLWELYEEVVAWGWKERSSSPSCVCSRDWTTARSCSFTQEASMIFDKLVASKLISFFGKLPACMKAMFRFKTVTARSRPSTVSTSSFSAARKSLFSLLRIFVASARSDSDAEILLVKSSTVEVNVAIVPFESSMVAEKSSIVRFELVEQLDNLLHGAHGRCGCKAEKGQHE